MKLRGRLICPGGCGRGFQFKIRLRSANSPAQCARGADASLRPRRVSPPERRLGGAMGPRSRALTTEMRRGPLLGEGHGFLVRPAGSWASASPTIRRTMPRASSRSADIGTFSRALHPFWRWPRASTRRALLRWRSPIGVALPVRALIGLAGGGSIRSDSGLPWCLETAGPRPRDPFAASGVGASLVGPCLGGGGPFVRGSPFAKTRPE